MSKVDKAILIARGERLKRLRSLAGMTSEELATQSGVSRASVSYWENANYSGLSHKGAESVVALLKGKGIYCSVEWLLLGLGAEPSFGGVQHALPGLHQEMALFTSLHPHAVVMQVLDDDLSPFFVRGDYVGGVWETHKAIQDNYYIVQTDGTSHVKKLKAGSHAERAAKIIRVWRQ